MLEAIYKNEQVEVTVMNTYLGIMFIFYRSHQLEAWFFVKDMPPSLFWSSNCFKYISRTFPQRCLFGIIIKPIDFYGSQFGDKI